jgi:transmembrane sensor
MGMEDLEKKYRNDSLTVNELSELREQVNASSDEQLSVSALEHWMNGDIDTSRINSDRIRTIKEKIDEQIDDERPSFAWKKVIQIAAAILLPIFILSTVYLYRENNQLASEEMTVKTGPGESANITLPDGTQVYLNSESNLCYIPKTYNKSKREIRFDGEGYFAVSKDKDRPFLIDAQGLQVRVLGTKFNLLARKEGFTAELALEEGSVSFTSMKNGDHVTVSPNQKAILDQLTGLITIEKGINIEEAKAWKLKEMIFRNEPLSSVIEAIEKEYNVHIKVSHSAYMTDLFTGTIPSNDIQEALEVLEKSYHFHSTMKDRQILITPIK